MGGGLSFGVQNASRQSRGPYTAKFATVKPQKDVGMIALYAG